MNDTIRHYSDDNIDICYDARRCIHAAECLRGLPAVFDTGRRPWILPTASSPDEIAAVITKCPSGALHYTRRDGGATEMPSGQLTIVPRPNGPLYVRGCVQLRSADGNVIIEDTRLALCRCGQSHNKPFCDNSHRGSGFRDSGVVTDGGVQAETETKTTGVLSITASANGPLLVEGPFVLRGVGGLGRYDGIQAELCRCGGSRNKPFCDGTHEEIGFRTEETDCAGAADNQGLSAFRIGS
jgi:CDGSH-type Zn-finger protein/uncharacterized Fe-S cluster protein YjdI